MDTFRLSGLDSLKELLASDDRDRPGVILFESWTSQPCLDLQPRIRRLAQAMPQFAFYEFNVDDYSDPGQDKVLTRLLEEWKVTELPAQILLPSNSRPQTIKATQVDEIRKALQRLY